MSRPSLLEVARSHPDLSLWTRAVEIAGWDGLLESGGPWTVLAPRDDAFARMAGPADEWLDDPERLCARVAAHLVRGRWMGRDLANAGALPTAAGNRLEVASVHGAIRIGEAIVTRADLPAANGTLHVVDDLLERVAA
ncbi:MAG: fasciclin domain-containing protein [Gemmatimonadota bacterium]|nr:fasciclin domain-containing protein [Gemmatimonadota bacterium]